MRANENNPLTFRPTDKNRLYLERLGFLDARSGRKKTSSLNLSRFINECLTQAMEGGHHNKKDIVSSEQLVLAYYEHRTIEAARAYERQGREWEEYRAKLREQANKISSEEAQRILSWRTEN